MTKINQDLQPQQHQNADDENAQNLRQNLEEEIKRLKNEVASLKKDHVSPVQYVIPV